MKFIDYLPKFKKAGDITSLLNLAWKQKHIQFFITDLVQIQLWQGKDSENKEIQTYSAYGSYVYSLYTISIKQATGLPSDRVTLYQTGSFYDSMRISTFKGGFEILADFKKTDGNILDNIPEGYQPFLLDLSEESLAELVDEKILPFLKIEIKKILGI